ncbi:MAG: hypothetical protein KKD05_07845 [Candidatus Omnitrophica bacterium]|nr:hypothetical protein [Candidatus Omnitrophota bacterium]
MIEINLLPAEYKVLRKSTSKNVPVNLILISSNAVLLVVLLIVTGMNLSRTLTLNAINTRLEGLAPEQQKIIALQRRMQSLKSTNALFSPFVNNRFLWSKKLYFLDELILPGIWLRNISLERKIINPMLDPNYPGNSINHLKIGASVVSITRDEMGIIGKLIRRLKTSDEFINEFSNIELEGVVSRSIASIEVMDFTLLCLFKPDVNL